ncbi:MAG: hypothetical protein EI684_23330 [Candidatus Viridilinea halotolerans]|uniref:YtkA-like domain-containing protein n=1 Tax=Candidatus Viridilinea halotolerans TaxID=2491704 RepID=A0A426TQ91_9CHLR|nr:MAG: hypothetical protein EI684_23330 [Candidatus Viridilinea halotolerans]
MRMRGNHVPSPTLPMMIMSKRVGMPSARLAASVLLLLTLSACMPARSRAVFFEEQQVRGVTMSLETVANPRLHLPYRFTVTLSDAQGNPLASNDIYLDLDMPAMPMGINRPIAEPEAPGRYSAMTVYTMPGDWEITVVAHIDGEVYEAVFLMYVEE